MLSQDRSLGRQREQLFKKGRASACPWVSPVSAGLRADPDEEHHLLSRPRRRVVILPSQRDNATRSFFLGTLLNKSLFRWHSVDVFRLAFV
jgi:hypothetical protein